jgi:CRISPR-associated protein Cmr4
MENEQLFIHVETPLHAGIGRGLGGVDLPIQRERVTNYPIVQGSSLKGRLRAAIREKKGWKDNDPELFAIFGKAEGEGQSYAGAVSVGDARLLLFPVRSLMGVFAWVTSRDVLNRFIRDTRLTSLGLDWQLPPEPDENECWAAPGSDVEADGKVTLEEFTYTIKTDAGARKNLESIGGWLARNALPQTTDEYAYWRDSLPKHLIILRREDFRDFALYGTEVTTHIKLVPDTKTVETGALWTVESLPTDTLLYAPLVIADSRAQGDVAKKAGEIKAILRELHHTRTQLGGDETTGRGVVVLHFLGKSEVKQ